MQSAKEPQEVVEKLSNYSSEFQRFMLTGSAAAIMAEAVLNDRKKMKSQLHVI